MRVLLLSVLGILLISLLQVSVEQNATIMAQRDLIRAMTTNPACMVGVVPRQNRGVNPKGTPPVLRRSKSGSRNFDISRAQGVEKNPLTREEKVNIIEF